MLYEHGSQKYIKMNKSLLLNSVEVIVDTHELTKNKIVYLTTGTWVDCVGIHTGRGNFETRIFLLRIHITLKNICCLGFKKVDIQSFRLSVFLLLWQVSEIISMQL